MKTGLLFLLLIFQFLILSCNRDISSGIDLETELRKSIAMPLAEFIVKNSGITQGICVEVDAVDGENSIALTRLTSMEFYPQASSETSFKKITDTVVRYNEC